MLLEIGTQIQLKENCWYLYGQNREPQYTQTDV